MSIQVRPLKRFGQNFLINEGIAKKIVSLLEIKSSDNIVEIGAGKGSLTKLILETGVKRLTAIEIDYRLLGDLRALDTKDTEFIIIQDDFLEVHLDNFPLENEKIKIIGNIPYNITSAIIFKLLEHFHLISRAVLMVQKEVAERIVAEPGNKEYGILSILTAIHGRVTKELNIKKNNFYPVPKVDSAILTMEFNDKLNDIFDYELFKIIVKGTFQTRRKMLHNSLKRISGEEITGLIKTQDLSKRPEELTVENFISLANEIYEIKKAVQ